MPLELNDTVTSKIIEDTYVRDWPYGGCGYHENGDLYIRVRFGVLLLSDGEFYERDEDFLAIHKTQASLDPGLKVSITITKGK